MDHAPWPTKPPMKPPMKPVVAAVLVCMLLVSAAALVIGIAGETLLRHDLSTQDDQQLRAYVLQLANNSFVIGPVFGGPKPAVASGGGISVELADPGGRRIPNAGTGDAGVPVSSRWISSHIGRLTTATGGRGSWRVIVERIHYQAHHIAFVYGSQDVSRVISARNLPGLPGVVVVGMSLAGIDHVTGNFAVVILAVTAVVLLLLAGAGTWALRFTGLPPSAQPGPGVPSAAAHPAQDRMGQAVADAADELRRSLSVISGFSDYYRSGRALQAARRDPVTLDRMMDRLAQETVRMETAADFLLRASQEAPEEPSSPAWPHPA